MTIQPIELILIMKKYRILEIVREKQPIKRDELFKLLKTEDNQFTVNAFHSHISRLKASNQITEALNEILTIKKFIEVIS